MRALSGGRSSTTRLINNGGGGASGALSAPSSWTRPLLRLRGRSIAAAAVALGGGGGGAGVGGVGGSVAPSSALLLLRSRLAVSAAVVVAATAGGAADEPDDFAQLEKTQQQQQERGQQPTDAAARDVAGDGDGASRPRRTSSSSDNSNTNSNSNSNNSSNEKNSNSFFSFLKDFGSPARRCTDVILVATVLGFAAQWLTRGAITSWGAKVNDLVWPGGQWWRLLTPSLLHAGALHLLINSHALWTLGPHLEAVAGGPRLCATYAASAVTGTALSVLLTPAPSVGASASIFGVGAALAVFYHRHRRELGARADGALRSLGLCLLLNAAYAAANRRVDSWGHVGGALGGALAGWLLGPRLVMGGGGGPGGGGGGPDRGSPRERASRGGGVARRRSLALLEDRPPLPWLAGTGPIGVAPRAGG